MKDVQKYIKKVIDEYLVAINDRFINAYTNIDAITSIITSLTENKADKATEIIAGSGLTGGGALSSNVTVSARSATTSQLGVVELATTEEHTTGVSTALACTPSGVAAMITAILQKVNVWTKAQSTIVTELSIVNNVLDWDLSNNPRIVVTLNQNITTFNITNIVPGTFEATFVQDGTGGRTINFPSIKWTGGVTPTVSEATNAEDILTLSIINSSNVRGIYAKDFLFPS